MDLPQIKYLGMWKASIPFPLGYTGHAGCVVTRTRFVKYRPADSTRTKTTLPNQRLGSTVRRKLACQKGLIMPQKKCQEKSIIPPGGFLAPSCELTGRRKQGGGCDVEHHCCKPGCSATSAGERRGENTRGGDNYSRRGHSRETAAPAAPAAGSGTGRIPAVPGAESPVPPRPWERDPPASRDTPVPECPPPREWVPWCPPAPQPPPAPRVGTSVPLQPWAGRD